MRTIYPKIENKMFRIVTMLLVSLLCGINNESCQKPQPQSRKPVPLDSALVLSILPEIRDSICSGTFSPELVNRLLGGRNRFNQEWQYWYLDSTKYDVVVTIQIQEDSTAQSILIEFPEGKWQKEQFAGILGAGRPPENAIPVKDGNGWNFPDLSGCKKAFAVGGWLNVAGSLRSISIFPKDPYKERDK
jgi:hypothetical protein